MCLPESCVLDFLRLSILEPDPFHAPSSGHAWHKRAAGMVRRPPSFWEITELYPTREKKQRPNLLYPEPNSMEDCQQNALVGNVAPKAGNRIRDVYVCGNDLSLSANEAQRSWVTCAGSYNKEVACLASFQTTWLDYNFRISQMFLVNDITWLSPK